MGRVIADEADEVSGTVSEGERSDHRSGWSSSPEHKQYRSDGYKRATNRGVIAVLTALVSALWVTAALDGGRSAFAGYLGLVVALGMIVWATAPYRSARDSFTRNAQALTFERARKEAGPVVTWSISPERELYLQQEQQRSGRRGAIAFTTAVASSLVLVVGPDWILGGLASNRLIAAVMGLAVAGCLAAWALLPYLTARRAYLERVHAAKAAAVEEALDDLVGDRDDPQNVLPLTSLFVFNRRQLDEYQTLTKRQAAVTFRNAQVAAGVGFTLLVVGAAVAMQQPSASGQFTVGALSAVGSSIGGYLSHIFFRAHERAMDNLRKYYEEPFLMSRALSAERVITKNTSLGDMREYLDALVRRLLDPGSLISATPGEANGKAAMESSPR